MPLHCRKNIHAIFLLALSCFSCYERRDGYFNDLSEARAKGAVERGWVPGFLPESSSLIREHHDLDTNEIWGTFRFDPSESPAFLSRLAQLGPQSAPFVRNPESIHWWPKRLTGEIQIVELAEEGFSVWREDVAGFFFAINPKSGEGFYWGGPR